MRHATFDTGMWARSMVVAAAVAGFWATRVTAANFTACANETIFLDSTVTPQDAFITSQADADTLVDPSTCFNVTGIFAGSIIISSDSLANIALNGISNIGGDLHATSSPSLEEINAPSLTTIAGQFSLEDLPSLSRISVPLLGPILEGLNWEALPALTNVSMKPAGANEDGNPGTSTGFLLIMNTGLEILDFLNFGSIANSGDINILENPKLGLINLSSLQYGGSRLEIRDNSASSEIILSNLDSVGDISLASAASIDLGSLTQTTGTLNISHTIMYSFSAPNLSTISGDFLFNDNYWVEDLDLPLLRTIGDGDSSLYNGDFIVANNTALQSISQIPKLQYADGTSNLTGNFTSINLPDFSFSDGSGGFHINSSDRSFDCSYFDKLASTSSLIQSNRSLYSCRASSPGDSTDTAKHYKASRAPSLSQSALTVIIIVSIVVGFVLLGFLLRCLMRKKTALATRRNGDRRGAGEVGMELEEMEGEDGEGESGRPPAYRRVGKPGELPPGYHESVNTPGIEGDSRIGEGVARRHLGWRDRFRNVWSGIV